MSGGRADALVGGIRSREFNTDLDRYVRTAGRFVFGDRTGLTIWLGVVLLLGLCWRIGFFITDTYPIANAVANLAEGRLAMQPTDFQYSLTLGTQPGLHEYDGAFYARNYGAVVAAVPILWLLEASSAVAAPEFVLAGAWSLGLLMFGRELATLLDRPMFRLVGGIGSIGTFVGATVFTTPLPREQLALVALQSSTLLAAGLVGVFCYRLVSTFHSRRVAVVGGIGLALATPVGFWATIPKRHVLVTALVFGSVLAFARSRQQEGWTGDLALGAAYGMLGLVAWVHAFEGFFLVISLFVVDIVTQPRKGKRRIAVTAAVFSLSLLPMILTNVLISGNPLQPPRLLPNVGPGSVELAPEPPADTGGDSASSGGGDGASSGGGDSAGSGGDGAGSGGSDSDSSASDSGVFDRLDQLLSLLFGLVTFAELVVSEIVFIGNYAQDTVTNGLRDAQEVGRLWSIFVRRGYYEYTGGNLAVNDFEPIDLTVLESTPVVGALVAVPVALAVRLRRGVDSLGQLSPGRQTDLLVVGYISVFTLVYLPRLPLFSQLTVRYLLPAIALLAYCVIRIPVVREAIDDAPRLLAGTYVGTVIPGTIVAVLVLARLDPALGEAIQFHALVNLTFATVLGLTVSARTIAPARLPSRIVAVSLALTGGATTSYVLLASLEYFTYGTYAFDFVRIVAQHVRIL